MIMKIFKDVKADSIPDSAPEELDTSDIPKAALETITNLFKGRAIWSRTGVVNHLKKEHIKHI